MSFSRRASGLAVWGCWLQSSDTGTGHRASSSVSRSECVCRSDRFDMPAAQPSRGWVAASTRAGLHIQSRLAASRLAAFPWRLFPLGKLRLRHGTHKQRKGGHEGYGRITDTGD